MINENQEIMSGVTSQEKSIEEKTKNRTGQLMFSSRKIHACYRSLVMLLLCLLSLSFAGCNGVSSGSSQPNSSTVAAGVIVDGLVYPTNFSTIDTSKAGILGLRAIDIPRHTQTGPLPSPAPERHWVLAPVPHNPKLPTIWTIGDSTVRCGVNATGEDKPGQWGWGTPFVGYFDPQKVNVVNRAVGGTTTASFYTSLWKDMVNFIKEGDVVIMQFGTNSGRGELRGIGEETRQATGRDGQPVTNHTYGWYIRKFIAETRAKGATPVVCSLIPRNIRDVDGKIRRSATSQAGWAKDVAAAEKADFIDLNELIARKYDAMEQNEVDALFCGSPHTSWAGAVFNAETVISGLKALNTDPVAAYYLPQVQEISAAPDLGNLSAITLHLAGDSTVKTYAATTTQEGWGQELGQFFIDKVTINNQAKGGANVKSFKNGRWGNILSILKAGDYVMIQFGANDSGTAHGPVTPADFAVTLSRMADEVKARKAIPIFVTPSAFYQWSGGKQDNTRLAPYAAAMVTAGAAQNVQVVDLNARGVEYLNSIGQTAAKVLYMPSHGTVDKAHFVKAGSTKIAQFVAEELRRIHSSLAAYLK